MSVKEKHSEWKQRLRRQCLNRRNTISETERMRWSERICSAAKAYLEAEAVLAYYPIGSEVDIRPLLEMCLDRKIPLYLPKTIGKEMAFYQVTELNSLTPGAFRVPEPEAAREHSFSKVVKQGKIQNVVMLVPGVGFDRLGSRMGYGAGFYDRWFHQWEQQPWSLTKIGVAYANQIVESIPTETHDIAMDVVITERELLEWKKRP